MTRRLIDLTEAELDQKLDQRFGALPDELRAHQTPALLDRRGLARALSCSARTVDRLRAEPNFPELPLFDSPRFELAAVLAWLRARNGGEVLRLVGGSK